MRVDRPCRGPSVDGRADSEQRASRLRHLVSAARLDAHGYQRTWAGERFLRTTEHGENPNLNFPYKWGEAPPLVSLLLGRRLRGWMGSHAASAACVRSLVSELKRLTNLQLFLDLSRLRAPLALSLVPLEEAQPAPFGAQGSLRDRRGSREPTRGTLPVRSPSRCIHGGADGRELSRLCVS